MCHIVGYQACRACASRVLSSLPDLLLRNQLPGISSYRTCLVQLIAIETSVPHTLMKEAEALFIISCRLRRDLV
jgi:hypothetical protein